ncbi:hypothetical protein [Okibacterium fritillariae]|uniref:Uncharacterized protein n=1 Tax=Okibacterium fritillariae TaxID=123320 RepID=A0A1T5IDP7_9MICO|nr:hypothetical protein [Okibacterium fritillariae]SKC37132.1 hypothetical protein SAMN06309945_0283 [Okibacterium fritillariae]
MTWIALLGCVILVVVSLGITYVIDQPDGPLDGATVTYMPLLIGFGFIAGIALSVICLAHALARSRGGTVSGVEYRHSKRTRTVLMAIGAVGIIGLGSGAIYYYVM